MQKDIIWVQIHLHMKLNILEIIFITKQNKRHFELHLDQFKSEHAFQHSVSQPKNLYVSLRH